jgi:hypothetical protein
MNLPKSTAHRCEPAEGFADGVGLDEGSFHAPDLVIRAELQPEPATLARMSYLSAAVAMTAVTAVTVTSPFMRALEFFRATFGASAAEPQGVASVKQVVARSELDRARGYTERGQSAAAE